MVRLEVAANPKIKLPVLYDELTIVTKHLVREAYIQYQKGLCCFCGEPLDGPVDTDIQELRLSYRGFPPNFWKYPTHLHHCHETGYTLGVVHNYCNAVLWQYFGE